VKVPFESRVVPLEDGIPFLEPVNVLNSKCCPFPETFIVFFGFFAESPDMPRQHFRHVFHPKPEEDDSFSISIKATMLMI
jgi:hypothetical protein